MIIFSQFWLIQVCVCVVHKRCHEMIITRCPGVPVKNSKHSVIIIDRFFNYRFPKISRCQRQKLILFSRMTSRVRTTLASRSTCRTGEKLSCSCEARQTQTYSLPWQQAQQLSNRLSSRFDNHNYMKFTWCDHCGSLLYGLTKQGLQCKGRSSSLFLKTITYNKSFQCAPWMCTNGARTWLPTLAGWTLALWPTSSMTW